ncbi:MAG: hypothetical protein CVU54_16350 [Deltaproteobacteria bacterium HGW-Deltaproteobacteria-12]|nr:MAG: hypothetical protein CVU54_16350 [Deltaproteobacteria bacterium HGW-Deltaproteobacteria-12]
MPDTDIFINPAAINVHTVIPAEAGIQNSTGCRIKPGMTTVYMCICRSNNKIIFFSAQDRCPGRILFSRKVRMDIFND